MRFGDAAQAPAESENKCGACRGSFLKAPCSSDCGPWNRGGPAASHAASTLWRRRVQKKKIWEEVQPGLNTTGDGIARWKDLEMKTAAGAVKVTRIFNGNIS